MIGVLLVTHGAIGETLLASAAQILNGRPEQADALGVSRIEDPELVLSRARTRVARLDTGSGVLILTDIFGATPCNVVAKLLVDGRVEGVAGVSLPMLLRVLTSRSGSPNLSLRGAVERALSGGAEGVVHVNRDACRNA